MAATFAWSIEEGTSSTILRLRGEIDLATIAYLEEAVAGLSGALVLDLEAVSFIDSSGVRWLLETRRRAQAEGRRVIVQTVSPAVKRVLEVSGLQTYLDDAGPIS